MPHHVEVVEQLRVVGLVPEVGLEQGVEAGLKEDGVVEGVEADLSRD